MTFILASPSSPHTLLHVCINIGVALVLGIVIGAERQWRSKAAGLRTTTLVSVGAALFTLMGVQAAADVAHPVDPTRVAAQIVSGIGFLGAGVIIKHGSTVTGLNTAATMWAAAAVGALSGAGFIYIAIIGAVLIIITNVLMRPLARWLERYSVVAQESEEVDYTIRVLCLQSAEMEIRQLLFDAASSPGMTVRSFSSEDEEEMAKKGNGPARVLLRTIVHAPERDDAQLEAALSKVVPHPAVVDVEWIADLV